MRWKGREQSENVEDRRGMSPQMALGGGGGLLMVIVVIVVKLLGGGQQAQNIAGRVANELGNRAQQQQVASEGIDDEYAEFVRVVLRDTETVWTDLFRRQVDISYTPPKLIMFSETVSSGCGNASAAMGPFYCPADKQVYIDPQFFNDLAVRHNAEGDFAQAYVIAHEVAHHVQNLLQFNVPVQQARQSGDEIFANQMSVRLELQADYLAGVWANHANRHFEILEPGDIEEAIQAANQIGDDTLQRQATGYVKPERFTHGTSKQRARWFKRGL
ncbi:MAG: neutral zinc metallopeptidase, partial [Planctomycetaceae bacterium]|nr:neutral zinc metallopeptidase [Planctomycetaceae bacterium]